VGFSANLVDPHCIRCSWGLSLLRGRAGAGLQATRLPLCGNSTGGCRAVARCGIRGVPAPLFHSELSRVVPTETAEVDKQQMRWVSRLWGET